MRHFDNTLHIMRVVWYSWFSLWNLPAFKYSILKYTALSHSATGFPLFWEYMLRADWSSVNASYYFTQFLECRHSGRAAHAFNTQRIAVIVSAGDVFPPRRRRYFHALVRWWIRGRRLHGHRARWYGDYGVRADTIAASTLPHTCMSLSPCLKRRRSQRSVMRYRERQLSLRWQRQRQYFIL